MASQKFGFVTIDPVSGSGNMAVNFSGDKYTGRVQRSLNFTITTDGGVSKALVVNQEAATETVTVDSPSASVPKAGGTVTITGKSNSTKLTFTSAPTEDNGLTEFVWSITIADVPANVTVEELVATLTVTDNGGQNAQVTITQAAGDSTLELDKEVINLDVNGTVQTVNVTSNDTWTWAQAAARTVLKMMGR